MGKRVKLTSAQKIAEICDAHSDLHVFAAIETLCEAALFRTKSGRRVQERINRIAKAASMEQYKAYERKRCALIDELEAKRSGRAQ